VDSKKSTKHPCKKQMDLVLCGIKERKVIPVITVERDFFRRITGGMIVHTTMIFFKRK
jgi:hypothetical protein